MLCTKPQTVFCSFLGACFFLFLSSVLLFFLFNSHSLFVQLSLTTTPLVTTAPTCESSLLFFLCFSLLFLFFFLFERQPLSCPCPHSLTAPTWLRMFIKLQPRRRQYSKVRLHNLTQHTHIHTHTRTHTPPPPHTHTHTHTHLHTPTPIVIFANNNNTHPHPHPANARTQLCAPQKQDGYCPRCGCLVVRKTGGMHSEFQVCVCVCL
jgi:hypothetical protein